ncbi:MAG TPA: hypothetical protein PK737_02205 [Bacilli bacterium]|nr:hypothetical protein [Bacilli bacterium]
MIEGYKVFDANMKNMYGEEFKVGETYHCPGPIAFGTQGQGWHFCKRLEDALRYAVGLGENFIVCAVTGFGKIIESFDDYNEYYDMYSASDMIINKALTRQEIIDYIVEANDFQIKRFISLYKLNPEEIKLFKNLFADSELIMNAIAYYQEGDKEVYTRVNEGLNLKHLK